MDETVAVNSNREIDLRVSVGPSPSFPDADCSGGGRRPHHTLRQPRLLPPHRQNLGGIDRKPVLRCGAGRDECLSVLDQLYQTGQPEIRIGNEDSAPFLLVVCMWPVLAADGRMVGSMIQVTEATSFHRQANVMNQALLIGSVRQHELTEQAEALSDLLRRANEDLKQFAFAASHDLQEPLRMMTIYSELLIEGHRGQLDGKAQICVDFITQGAKQMRDLLANLLTYTEAGADSWSRTNSSI